jgi:hypothetical protein
LARFLSALSHRIVLNERLPGMIGGKYNALRHGKLLSMAPLFIFLLIIIGHLTAR